VPCDSFSAPVQGYMIGIFSACLPASVDVYREYLMKKNDSLYTESDHVLVPGLCNVRIIMCCYFELRGLCG
jgi:hypothetical protein